MPWLLLGLLVLAFFWAVGRWGLNTSPRNLRWTGLGLLALVCLLAALWMAARGQLAFASAFATGALALYGRYRWIKGIIDRIAAAGGRAGEPPRGRTTGQTTVATDEEAYAILGLKPGASRDAILAAHRRLMRIVHPDHGGTDYLAAKINQARDILLRKSDHS
ncbi:DnaJ domain-containing protein [Pedomonas mirosovicensis]|uniref:DnaJ domain-containing protein n=1 Tax=Pedomonas mirosovicensis TaxID=2908641 RepID=UPI002167D64B|nr:DnaJ domain-containing protein [Pedomonas mirosovicensis]MCH8685950.1 DnaJ domain-containing protein [Pedomonas mirosovicensis]